MRPGLVWRAIQERAHKKLRTQRLGDENEATSSKTTPQRLITQQKSASGDQTRTACRLVKDKPEHMYIEVLPPRNLYTRCSDPRLQKHGPCLCDGQMRPPTSNLQHKILGAQQCKKQRSCIYACNVLRDALQNCHEDQNRGDRLRLHPRMGPKTCPRMTSWNFRRACTTNSAPDSRCPRGI